jgi:hypothetical protein
MQAYPLNFRTQTHFDREIIRRSRKIQNVSNTNFMAVNVLL